MSYLSLVRHGQSEWNEKNLFTGWENPGLTDKGLTEAEEAGANLNNLGKIMTIITLLFLIEPLSLLKLLSKVLILESIAWLNAKS